MFYYQKVYKHNNLNVVIFWFKTQYYSIYVNPMFFCEPHIFIFFIKSL